MFRIPLQGESPAPSSAHDTSSPDLVQEVNTTSGINDHHAVMSHYTNPVNTNRKPKRTAKMTCRLWRLHLWGQQINSWDGLARGTSLRIENISSYHWRMWPISMFPKKTSNEMINYRTSPGKSR